MTHSGKNFLRLLLSSLFATVLLLCSPGAARAATARSIGQILSKTEANYQTIHAFTAVFTQKTVSAAATTLGAQIAEGRLYYAKPRQMRWEYDKPEKQVFVANNNFAWLYSESENRITTFDAKKLFASPLASTFFDGAMRLRDHFSVTLDPAMSTPQTAVLQLRPLRHDPSIKLAYIWIDRRSFLISRVQTKDLLGNTNEITLSSFTPRPNLSPGLFLLQVPAKAGVCDANGRMLTPEQIRQLQVSISSGAGN
ncbi:MAG: LolA family protein [Syntrophobacteraceae bacterium]